jgi:hypothetical protein
MGCILLILIVGGFFFWPLWVLAILFALLGRR